MRIAMVATLVATALLPQAVSGDPPAVAQHLATVPLIVGSGRRIVRFRVEVARTAEQQEIGLMYRKAMPAMAGMLFPMDPPRGTRFWMKNTYIPLDLIFIRKDRTISSIAADVAPRVTFPTIDSTEPVAAVLELNGGAAARNNIRPGDTVRW